MGQIGRWPLTEFIIGTAVWFTTYGVIFGLMVGKTIRAYRRNGCE